MWTILCYFNTDNSCILDLLMKLQRLVQLLASYHLVFLFSVKEWYCFLQLSLLDIQWLVWFNWSICHILFQFKHLVLFHWSIRHVLFQFNLLTLCIHLFIHYSCLLLFLCIWCWLRATSSLLVPLADADSEQTTTQSPSSECHQQADNSRNGCSCSCRQAFVWNRSKDWWGQIGMKG